MKQSLCEKHSIKKKKKLKPFGLSVGELSQSHFHISDETQRAGVHTDAPRPPEWANGVSDDNNQEFNEALCQKQSLISA